MPLLASQRAEAVLGQDHRGLGAPWQSGPLHRFVTGGVPRFLSLLQHASLLGQQELRSESAPLLLTKTRKILTMNTFSSHLTQAVRRCFSPQTSTLQVEFSYQGFLNWLSQFF